MAEEEVPLLRSTAYWFSVLLFLAGILFYLIWGITYGSWNLLQADWIGAYAVTVVLVGFGLVGMLLYRK